MEFEEYCWIHKIKSGLVDEIPVEHKERFRVLCNIGNIRLSISPRGETWKFTTWGWKFVKLKYKPLTLWERIMDFLYKHTI